MHPLKALAEHGQSIWIDYIRRGMTRSGELARLVREDGVRGVTSNPSIFAQAIAGSKDYADQLETLTGDADLDAKALYERVAILDIREACDVLQPVYASSEKRDGFVSFEVSPGLARDRVGTVGEARRLWAAVERPNLMIKVPGTPEGIQALETLIGEGINVNVTLIFACEAYENIARAYLRGLQTRAQAGGSLTDVASVASFFVSRIDTEIDARLDARLAAAAEPAHKQALSALRGQIAIANAKLAYRLYETLLSSDTWKELASRGARPQRLLWASTGTKDKAYSDVLYVDQLIGRDTVNTVPPQTLDAFRDHGAVAETLTADVDGARAKMQALADAGISMQEVTQGLLDCGLALFSDAMDGLLATVASLQRKIRGSRLTRTQSALPGALHDRVEAALTAWDVHGNTGRLWARDPSLWTDSGEERWLGWLDGVATQQTHTAALQTFAREVQAQDIHDVVVIGMGGSSLCPDVLSRTYGAGQVAKGWPRLRILDSTVPAQVAAMREAIDPAHTLFVVASKSGTTLEPTVLCESLFELATSKLGGGAGAHFVAITDPGSKLQALAERDGYAHVFPGVPEIGGRFSALSNFGMVPAAAMGLDTGSVLAEAERMVEACRTPKASDNPGVLLGTILATAAAVGRNKLTLVLSPAIAGFGAWIEQLVAESTGKEGKAIIPVDGETPTAPERYSNDRLFVYVRLLSTPDHAQDRAVAALEAAGQAVVRIELDDVDALPQEFFRWEIATAVAGAIMQIHPFDQPDVEAAKVATRELTSAYETTGMLAAPPALFKSEGISLSTDPGNAQALGRHSSLAGYLQAHFARIEPGDYVALLAFLDMHPAHEQTLQRIRHRVRDATGNATCLGFGPRFLHSTGQAYKGGPNQGVFLQILADTAEDVPIPGRPYGFSVVAAAQALGDFDVLAQRHRRALRIHLGQDVTAGLATLERAVAQALTPDRVG